MSLSCITPFWTHEKSIFSNLPPLSSKNNRQVIYHTLHKSGEGIAHNTNPIAPPVELARSGIASNRIMPKLQKVDDKEPVPPKRLRRGNVPGKKSPPSPISAKKPATPPSSNTRSGGRRAKTTKTIAARGKSKGGKNATPQKGKKRRKAMPSIHEDSDKEQSLLSPPTASRKTAAPSPMTAAAAGTLAYLNQYSEHGGGGSRAGEAVESEEEYDLLEDGNVVVSRSSKKVECHWMKRRMTRKMTQATQRKTLMNPAKTETTQLTPYDRPRRDRRRIVDRTEATFDLTGKPDRRQRCRGHTAEC